MKKNKELYELIYEYYESRILFGVYRYGEQLLSVPKICASFRLGRNTIQTALDKLEKNGYIKTEERKVARVVYHGTQDVYLENTAKYFVPRKDGILDFAKAGDLLFLPMWKIGARKLELDKQRPKYEDQNTARTATLPIPVKLFCDALRTFHNDLILNLYWQCLRYLSFLYPKRYERERDTTAGRPVEPNDPYEMKAAFDEYLIETQNKVLDFIESAREEYHLEEVDQIPFTWNIYRRRPQVRYTLASVIIRDILWERYPVGSYLPSLPKMAEQYQVSLSTVRRTLEVLHSLGLTRTDTGIGIKVCPQPVSLDVMNTSEIRENMRMHGEAMQILALTVRNVTVLTLESISNEKKEELLHKITELYGKTSAILCIDVLLSFIACECPSAMIRECYDKLRELTVWGYILSAALMGAGQLDNNFTDFVSSLEEDLQTGNAAAFAKQWQSFIENRMNFLYSKFPFQD